MLQIEHIYTGKAEESLAGAGSEFANGRYNNCANRCYYACFQAAVGALIREGIQPPGQDGEWSHSFVQASFAGELIARRKRYPSELRDSLSRLLFLRHLGDYQAQSVTETQAGRAVRRAEGFVEAITSKGGER